MTDVRHAFENVLGIQGRYGKIVPLAVAALGALFDQGVYLDAEIHESDLQPIQVAANSSLGFRICLVHQSAGQLRDFGTYSSPTAHKVLPSPSKRFIEQW